LPGSRSHEANKGARRQSREGGPRVSVVTLSAGGRVDGRRDEAHIHEDETQP